MPVWRMCFVLHKADRHQEQALAAWWQNTFPQLDPKRPQGPQSCKVESRVSTIGIPIMVWASIPHTCRGSKAPQSLDPISKTQLLHGTDQLGTGAAITCMRPETYRLQKAGNPKLRKLNPGPISI